MDCFSISRLYDFMLIIFYDYPFYYSAMEKVKSEFITIKIEPGTEEEICNDAGNFAMVESLSCSGGNANSSDRSHVKEMGKCHQLTTFVSYSVTVLK